MFSLILKLIEMDWPTEETTKLGNTQTREGKNASLGLSH